MQTLESEYQPLKRFLTVPTVAEIWGVTTETIYRMIRNNKLPHMKIGSAIRVPVESVKAYEQERLMLCQDQETNSPNLNSSELKTNVIQMDIGRSSTLPIRKTGLRNASLLARKAKKKHKDS